MEGRKQTPQEHNDMPVTQSKNNVTFVHWDDLEVMAITIMTIRQSPPFVQPIISSLQTSIECPLERPARSPHSQLCSRSAFRYPIIVHCNKLPLYSSALVTENPPFYLVISSHFVPNLLLGVMAQMEGGTLAAGEQASSQSCYCVAAAEEGIQALATYTRRGLITGLC